MKITQGDFVRPSNSFFGLPLDSVWRVVSADGSLKLEPENDAARNAKGGWLGHRYPHYNFDRVVLFRGKWVLPMLIPSVGDPSSECEDPLPPALLREYQRPVKDIPQPVLSSADAVTTATDAAEQAARQAEVLNELLESARKRERQRQEELREAKAAKAKADKVAAARAKADEARRALSAKLHADRCLGEATLDLIAEVSRLSNGGPEKPAAASIAAHVEQLQPLARSYGYRIAKPSMIALVVPL